MFKFRKNIHTAVIEKNKETYDLPFERMPDPDEIIILLPQFEGDTSKIIVEEGAYVVKGQRIAEDMESIPVHSSISGNVEEILELRVHGSEKRTGVRIVSDGKGKISEKVIVPEIETKKAYLDCIRRAGVLNGKIPAFKDFNREKVTGIVVSGLESDTVITAGYRTLEEDIETIVAGISVTMKYLEADNAVICISEEYTGLIEDVKKGTSTHGSIFVKPVKKIYVPENEKIKRMVLSGTGSESDDILYTDIWAMLEIGTFFKTGMPVVEKRITVAGDIIREHKNLIVPLGARIADVIQYCGGYIKEPRKIIDNGTMTGRCLSSDRLPVTKETRGIIAFEGKKSLMPPVKNCIRCGACYRTCPEELMPIYISKAFAKGKLKSLIALKAEKCISCGCCTYSCPAKIPLHKICTEAKSLLEEVKANG